MLEVAVVPVDVAGAPQAPSTRVTTHKNSMRRTKVAFPEYILVAPGEQQALKAEQDHAEQQRDQAKTDQRHKDEWYIK